MGLGDAFQESTDTALRVMASRPFDLEPPKPKHSAWSVIPRAVAGAFTEVGGNIMDVASAYGQVQAATGANANPLIPDSPEDRKQRLEAFDKLKTGGIDWQPEESRPHYQMARDLRPDPITAGAAENIVFGLTKGLTKAIGAGMIAGPMAGAGVFGASEGLQTAEDLAAQGVDVATRTKAGAVSGVMNAAGMALPVAGKTLAGTAALVAVGGPAQFMAQQAATRHILQSADYGRLAMQFDPLDPVGLAVATLLPAGFATWAKAGAISAAMKGKPKAAADPVPVVNNPLTAEPARPVATQDQVDAAMVHNLTIARDAHEAVPIEAVQAALEPAPRVGASDTAAKSLPPDVERAALKKAGDVQNENDAFDIAEEIRSLEEGGGVDLSKLFENPKFWDSENEQWTPEGQAAADGVTRKQAIENLRLRDITELSDLNLAHHKAQYAAMLEILDGLRIPYTDTSSAQSKYIEVGGRKLRFADHANQVRDSAVRGSLPVLNVAPGEATFADALRVVMEITPTANKSLLSQGLPRDGMQERAVRADKSGSPEPAQSGIAVGGEAKTTGEAGKRQDPHIANTLSRVEALKAQSPDMPVALREDGTPVTLADELDAIRQQAREGTADTFGADDAPLIQVAVECMLSMGAG